MELKEILEYRLLDIGDYHISVYKLIGFFTILIVARLIVFVVSNFVLRAFSKSTRFDPSRHVIVVKLIKYFIYIIAIVIALQHLGINVSIFIASSAALFVGLGLGLQNVFTDVISGVFIMFEKTIELDDLIEIDGIVGRVKEINLRTSKVRTRSDIMMIVPNSSFINGRVINWSSENKTTRFDIRVGVAYGSDTELVRRLLIKCAKEHSLVEKTPEPFVRFMDFGDSSLDFDLSFWTASTWEVERTKSDIRFKIDEAFRLNGVTIPFPQRDLYIKQAPKNK